MHPKFIIEETETGDELYIGYVKYHRELKSNRSAKVKGGGWWSKDNDAFVLFGESQDFGPASIKDINDCIRNKKVFTNYTGTVNLTDKHEFKYRNEYTNEIIDLPFVQSETKK